MLQVHILWPILRVVSMLFNEKMQSANTNSKILRKILESKGSKIKPRKKKVHDISTMNGKNRRYVKHIRPSTLEKNLLLG